MIVINIIVLFLFLQFVENYPKLKSYSPDTKFNFYRSLLCLFFSLYSLENIINYGIDGFNEPIKFKAPEVTDITEWFIAYLMVDIGKMIWMKNTRIDLYIHHVWSLIIYSISYFNDDVGFMNNIVLIAEAISIVSGIDSLHMELNEMEKSKQCKVYRKNIIRYLRIPVWIFIFIYTLKQGHKLPTYLYWNGILSPFLMLGLDIYWERKCSKVIESKNKI